MYGSGYFRNNVLYQHEYSENAICTVDRCVNRIYSFDPDFWGVYRMCDRYISNSDGQPNAGDRFYSLILSLTAGGGEI